MSEAEQFKHAGWRYRYNRLGDGQPWRFSAEDPEGYIKEEVYIKTEEPLVQPRWIDLTIMHSEYEEQLDINSDPAMWRHRLKRFTGQPIDPWKEGKAP